MARKEAEIARKDSEVARKDAQVARYKARVAQLERTIATKDEIIDSLQIENAAIVATSESNPSLPADFATAQQKCAQLEAEKRDLSQDKQSLEKTIETLRSELAQVKEELAHAAKWLKRYNDESFLLTESSPIT